MCTDMCVDMYVYRHVYSVSYTRRQPYPLPDCTHAYSHACTDVYANAQPHGVLMVVQGMVRCTVRRPDSGQVCLGMCVDVCADVCAQTCVCADVCIGMLRCGEVGRLWKGLAYMCVSKICMCPCL